MKHLFLLLLASLAFEIPAYAVIRNAPFMPEVDARFDALEGNYQQNSGLGLTFGLHPQQLAVATYDFATNGASTVSLPVVLPAGALITRDYFFTKTAVGPSTVNLAWSCQTANNIVAATAASSFGTATTLDGVSTGTAANMKNITSPCNVQVTVTGAPVTAGTVTGFLEYVMHP